MAEHFQGQGQTMQRLEGIGVGLSIGSLSKSGREITGGLVINPINETRRVFNQSERESYLEMTGFYELIITAWGDHRQAQCTISGTLFRHFYQF